MTSIKNLPSHRRPREKLVERGPAGLSDAELIAVLLRVGVRGKSAIQLGEVLVNKFGLKGLLTVKLDDLKEVRGLGTAKAAQLLAAFELAKRANDGPSELPLNNAERVVNLLNDLRLKKKEHFVALYLNARHRLLERELVSVGHLTGSLVHPREVFKPALELSAAFVILAHNHPSGDLTPSQDDIGLTKRLVEVGQLLDVPILDHIIIAKEEWVSMKELEFL
jgi:DNA repair protein RadC